MKHIHKLLKDVNHDYRMMIPQSNTGILILSINVVFVEY